LELNKKNLFFILISFGGLVLTLYSTYILDASSSKFEYCLELGVNASTHTDYDNRKFIDANNLNNTTTKCSTTAISESNAVYPQIIGIIMTLFIPILTIDLKEDKRKSKPQSQLSKEECKDPLANFGSSL
jgi:hypothetical protein